MVPFQIQTDLLSVKWQLFEFSTISKFKKFRGNCMRKYGILVEFCIYKTFVAMNSDVY